MSFLRELRSELRDWLSTPDNEDWLDLDKDHSIGEPTARISMSDWVYPQFNGLRVNAAGTGLECYANNHGGITHIGYNAGLTDYERRNSLAVTALSLSDRNKALFGNVMSQDEFKARL